MRGLSLIGLLLGLAVVAWLAKHQMSSGVLVPTVPAGAASDAPGQAAATRPVPVTQVPQQVQRSVEALSQDRTRQLDTQAGEAGAPAGGEAVKP